MSQEQVALDAGLAVYTYNLIERGCASTGGAGNPTLETVMRVLLALDMDWNVLIELNRDVLRCDRIRQPAQATSPGFRW